MQEDPHPGSRPEGGRQTVSCFFLRLASLKPSEDRTNLGILFAGVRDLFDICESVPSFEGRDHGFLELNTQSSCILLHRMHLSPSPG